MFQIDILGSLETVSEGQIWGHFCGSEGHFGGSEIGNFGSIFGSILGNFWKN